MSQIVLKKGESRSETLIYASPLYINGNTVENYKLFLILIFLLLNTLHR